MKYVLFETQRAVIMTECAMGELMDSEYKVFYIYSEAVDYFQRRVSRFNRVYYYASCIDKKITIEATPENDRDLYHGLDGPYEDFYIAYGFEHIKKQIKDSNIDDQFGLGASVTFGCYADCGDHDYCIVRTMGQIETNINVSPLNDVHGIETGRQFTLRLMGNSDEIYAFRSPEELSKTLHLPPKIIIPVGVYRTDPAERDTSIILTGCITQISRIVMQGKYRNQMLISTMAMDVSIDALTDYEIGTGDFVCVRTNLSAMF